MRMYVHATRVARVSALLALGGCIGEAVAGPEEDGDDQGATHEVGTPQVQGPDITTVSLSANADTTIRAQADNRNFGGAQTLDVNRSLVRIDTAAITGAVGPTDFLIGAELELALVENEARADEPTRTLAAHRMSRTWTETGATWRCGNDTRPSNRRADCAPGTAWNMTASSPPFLTTATASAAVPQTATGTVVLDVTSDVREFLARTATNNGWLLKTTAGSEPSSEIVSREGGAAPALRLTIQRCSAELCDDDNACTTDSCSALGACVHTDAANGVACDDGNTCTVADACERGSCAGEDAPDGTSCGEGETCNAGACGGGDIDAQVVINEIESSGGEPGDWVELYNAGTEPIDLSGFMFKDNDDTHAFYVIPANTELASGAYLVLEEADIGFGLGGADSARLFDTSGTTIIDSYEWAAHAATSYGRCPNGSGDFATTASATKGASNDCEGGDGGTEGGIVVINEVESSGGQPGDWIELYNAGTSSIDLSGYRFKDNDDTHAFYTIPSGTELASGGYLILEEADIGFGLGGADSARLFDAINDAPVDTYSWAAHAATTFGRCPDGVGAFATTSAVTKGGPNDCTPSGVTFTPWPGSSTTTILDEEGAFPANLSGLVFQAAGTALPAILWGVQNSPSVLYRLEQNGAIWTPATTDDWAGGKTLVYPDGSGSPDAEGVTLAEPGSSFVYVATERDNDVSASSRLSILRFDVNAVGDTLTATHEWNVTNELPAVGSNAGLEGIAWVPDAYLTSHSFADETTGQPYAPQDYPNHGGGLFLVGVESGGEIYAFALDHTASTFTLVAAIESGQAAVMDLVFDAETNALWAYCDSVCGNKATVLGVETEASAATFGAFTVKAAFDHPSGLPDVGNEGFAIAACVGEQKAVFWADDEATGAHSLREGALSCEAPF